MRHERLINDFTTTLTATCTIGASTIQIADAGNLPLEGDYRIVIDAEIMGVTGRNGNVLSVIRAEESTVAVEHANGAEVQIVVTVDSLEALRVDRPPLWYPNDTWQRYLRCEDQFGGVLDSSDFTGVNLGARGSLADGPGGSMVATVNDDNPTNGHHIWYLNAPSTPYKVTLGCYGLWKHSGGTVYPQCGIVVADSTAGDRNTSWQWMIDEGDGPCVQVSRMTDPATFSSSPFNINPTTMGPIWWLQFYDDNTYHKFNVSYDSVHWITAYQETRTSWLTNAGNKVGFFFDAGGNDSGIPQKVIIRHFQLEEL